MASTKSYKIDELKANFWNDNIMTEEVYSFLTDTMSRFGNLQPILVWEKGNGEKVILDGEHRWKSDKQRGATEIECKVLSDDDLLQAGRKMREEKLIDFEVESKSEEVLMAVAQTLTIIMNSIKGEPDPIKRAKILLSISNIVTIPGMSKMLHMSEQTIDSYKMLLQMSDEELEKSIKKLTTKPLYNEIKLIFNDKEMKIWDKAARHSGLKSMTEVGLHLAKEYLTANGISFEALEEIELPAEDSPEPTDTAEKPSF